jgi:hypothetical protein
MFSSSSEVNVCGGIRGSCRPEEYVFVVVLLVYVRGKSKLTQHASVTVEPRGYLLTDFFLPFLPSPSARGIRTGGAFVSGCL